MSEAELYAVAGIAVCSGTIGFVIGMKTAWNDAKKFTGPTSLRISNAICS